MGALWTRHEDGSLLLVPMLLMFPLAFGVGTGGRVDTKVAVESSVGYPPGGAVLGLVGDGLCVPFSGV